MANDIQPGTYKARLIMSEVQFGETESGKPQMILLADVPDLGTFSVPLFFSAEAAPYSIPKLRAAGWTGKDLSDLTGLGTKDVLITIKKEMFEGKERLKVDLAGGGGFSPAKPLDQKTFAAKVAAITAAGGGSAPTGSGGAPF